MSLKDYKEIVGNCAVLSTIGLMSSGILICKNIYKKGTAEDCDPMPFLGGIGMCILMLRYAWIVGDPAMININIFGLMTNTLYMAVYYYYSPAAKQTLALIGKAAIFVTILLIYAEFEHPDNIEYKFGIIVTVLHLSFLASPLLHLGTIIRTKDTSILPFPLIFMGTLVTFQWLIYGFIIDNNFVIFQNAIGFVLSLAQLSLFIIFPTKSTKVSMSDQKKED